MDTKQQGQGGLRFDRLSMVGYVLTIELLGRELAQVKAENETLRTDTSALACELDGIVNGPGPTFALASTWQESAEDFARALAGVDDDPERVAEMIAAFLCRLETLSMIDMGSVLGSLSYHLEHWDRHGSWALDDTKDYTWWGNLLPETKPGGGGGL